MGSRDSSTFSHALSTASLENTPKPGHNISNHNLSEARSEFESILGRDSNLISAHAPTLKAHSSTEWSPSPTSKTASLILYPQSTAHVSSILKVCHKRFIPVTPFTGGTSFDGALAATRGGICLDLSQMNAITAIHARDLDAVVQAGVKWDALNKELAPTGLFFPVDPGPSAAIGGMIATNCSGTNAYRYGTMKDWVISCTVVLADGTIVKTRHRPRKSSAGYDLTRMVVGSSGTLGVVTEAVVRLTAIPQNVQVAVVSFPGLKEAVDSVVELVQQGQQLEAMELLDAQGMKAIDDSKTTKRRWRAETTIFFKFGGSEGIVAEQVKAVKEVTSRYGRLSYEVSSSKEDVDDLWSGRKQALMSALAARPNPTDRFVTSDVAVPISRLAEIIGLCHKMIDESGFWGSVIGHVGDGMPSLFSVLPFLPSSLSLILSPPLYSSSPTLSQSPSHSTQP